MHHHTSDPGKRHDAFTFVKASRRQSMYSCRKLPRPVLMIYLGLVPPLRVKEPLWLSSQSRAPRGLTQVLCLTVTFFVSPTLASIVLPLNLTTYDVCHDQDTINSMQMPSDSEVLDPPSSLHGTRSYRVMPHTQVPTRISICLSDPVRVLAQTPTCDLAIMASTRSHWYSNSTYSPESTVLSGEITAIRGTNLPTEMAYHTAVWDSRRTF